MFENIYGFARFSKIKNSNYTNFRTDSKCLNNMYNMI